MDKRRKKENAGLKSRMLLAFALMAMIAAGQQAANPLAVPAVGVDGNGLFTVADCPTTHDVLEVQLQEGEYCYNEVRIYADGMLMQSVNIGDDSGVTRDMVHFLDANYDGNVDILIGPGTNREYSALLLWDNEENRFVRATNDGFGIFNGDFFYEPERMVIYRRTSSSCPETTYTMMVWQGSDLQSEETLLIISDKSEYEKYRVSHRYTLRSYYSDEDVISTDDRAPFEDSWCEWAIAKIED
ncbi:MAG: hypothetical protein IJK93_03560 [Muribaculaceae bacterium]|nr:hypothetical protein [Muribaculaceae bacterium]